jgi:hypothetical protein
MNIRHRPQSSGKLAVILAVNNYRVQGSDPTRVLVRELWKVGRLLLVAFQTVSRITGTAKSELSMTIDAASFG